MNYIKQSVAFFELQLTHQISLNAQAVYHTLFNINNKCCWKEKFTVTNTMLMAYTGLSVQGVHRARNELIQLGLIIYKKGKGNQCGEYELIRLYNENESENGSNLTDSAEANCHTNDNQTDKEIGTLNKQNKTKLNKTKLNIKKGLLNNFCQPMPDFKRIEEIALMRQKHF